MSRQQEIFIKKNKQYKFIIHTIRIVILILFIILWETAAQLGWIESFIFSSPSRILKCFIKMTADKSIFTHTAVTLGETFLSFSLITLIGIGTAIILWLYTPLFHIFETYLVVLNSIPKSAIAPMLIVWLGNNPKAIIVTAVSIALFSTILNVYTSFASTDPDKIKLMRTFRASKTQIMLKLVFPASLGTIISNMKVNIGLCLVGVIIGEFLAARAGLGYLIIYNSQIFCMDPISMSILILCAISILLFKIIDILEKKMSQIF